MDDYIQLFGLISVPVGILLMCFAALWQMYVMFTETGELDRYEGKNLAKVVAWLFFTFSLAVYWFCPKARRKGVVFALTLGLGLFLYLFSTMYIFKVLYPPPSAAPAETRVEKAGGEKSPPPPALGSEAASKDEAQSKEKSETASEDVSEAKSEAASEAERDSRSDEKDARAE